jgi:hypothetical protein
MSEAELHILRSRMRGGILSKARRGELRTPLPVGLVYDPLGKVALDPDAAVQGALRHLFECFERTGSARAVVKELAAQRLSFPQRIRSGPRKGEIVWAALDHYRVLQVLHNPRYAGAFTFGRKQAQYVNGKTSHRRMPRERWIALIQDAHPGYISFQQWEANQAALLANAQARGEQRRASPPREGPALLQGMIVCGRCGGRMTVRYHQRRGQLFPDYLCQKESVERAAESTCQVIPGTAVDDAIASLLLDTLTPVTLEVALNVAAELEQRAKEADQLRLTVGDVSDDRDVRPGRGGGGCSGRGRSDKPPHVQSPFVAPFRRPGTCVEGLLLLSYPTPRCRRKASRSCRNSAAPNSC